MDVGRSVERGEVLVPDEAWAAENTSLHMSHQTRDRNRSVRLGSPTDARSHAQRRVHHAGGLLIAYPKRWLSTIMTSRTRCTVITRFALRFGCSDLIRSNDVGSHVKISLGFADPDRLRLWEEDETASTSLQQQKNATSSGTAELPTLTYSRRNEKP